MIAFLGQSIVFLILNSFLFSVFAIGSSLHPYIKHLLYGEKKITFSVVATNCFPLPSSRSHLHLAHSRPNSRSAQPFFESNAADTPAVWNGASVSRSQRT